MEFLTNLTLDTTWHNKTYKNIIKLAFLSFFVGGLAVGLMYYGNSVLDVVTWIMLFIYAFLLHVFAYKLANQ